MQLAIFLPGLQLQPGEPDLEKYAIRLKKALDINDQTTAHHYTLKMGKEKFGPNDGEEVDVATIKLTTPDKTVDDYKIYGLNYEGLLTGGFDRRSPLYQCFYLVWTMLSGLPRFVKPIFLPSKRKTLSNHYQLKALFVFAVLFLAAIFLISLLPAAIILLLDLSSPGIPLLTLKSSASLLLSLGALVYLLWPGLKSAIGILFKEYLCLDSYLKDAHRKAVITSKFDTLLEYIAEQHPAIEGIELHAYSFGSIVAYDVLFPPGAAPGERIRSKIHQLITIGSPHDFIENYYPSYFKRRKRYQLALTSWYNVYSTSDILSSNFRHDSKPGPATFAIIQGEMLPENINYEVIQPDAPGWWDIFRLYILKIHSGYWETNEDATSCLTVVVQAIHSYPPMESREIH